MPNEELSRCAHDAATLCLLGQKEGEAVEQPELLRAAGQFVDLRLHLEARAAGLNDSQQGE